MLRTTLAGLRLHKGRLVTTALAIALGVMFVSGTLVFSDTLRESFTSQVMASAQTVDAVAQPEADADQGISREVLDDVRALPEIDRAAGVTRAPAPLLDKDGRAVGSVPTLGVSVGEVTRYSAAEGELPDGPDEAALATTTADTTGYEVGDTATVLGPEGQKHDFTVTGLIDFGISGEINYRGAVAFTPATAAEMTGTDTFAEIDAIAAEGVTAEQAVQAVSAVTASGTEVLTGQELGERLAEQAGLQAEVLTVALLLFAMISMLVAAIVIHNTFAILVAQRQREMALLRCVGAVRGQVFGSVVIEALVVGLLASAAGVAAGIGLGTVGFALGSQAFASGSAETAVVVTPQTVLIGLGVGTAMTLFAALLPARRAMFVPPLAALRTSAVATGLGKRLSAVRVAVGALLLLASAGVVAFAMRDVGPEVGLYLVTGAGMIAFVGVVVLSPLLVRAAVAAIAPLMRATGVSATLAADNARRNPRRAATAMIALTVGATLISGYSVINATMMATTTEMLDRQFPVDYQIQAQFSEDSEGVPGEVGAQLRDSSAVGRVISQRSATVEGDERLAFVYTYRGADPATVAPAEARAGDLADVRPGHVAVHADFAGDSGVGDTLTLETEEGRRSYTIAAVVGGNQGAWSVLMAPRDFAAAFPGVDTDELLMVTGAEDAEDQALADAIDSAVAEYPTVQVDSVAQMRQQYEDVLATAFLAIVAMLGLAVVIAVFGIANTLALSVLERTRESAMLRALGLKRGQLRLMLSIEAALLCLIGALVGIALGVSFGWAAAAAIFDTLVFQVPAAQIGGFIAAAVAAGLLASVLPSRRAARTSITAALASE
ncbi:ABC transporter permease [Streptomonospora litoralis]|uniref:Macrolide export ATP-binding/permease protein MacB n=1 Tax=Streptomonospora litoralis TaxID=2498135 RepID=A0A4P6Q733_9ACTN|nr:ABC transporter permease [Streptomonospora litoralis]QBI54627.1 Macrolide export ATP-binding/permease protein MacB [Streptomonospora litoralis]